MITATGHRILRAIAARDTSPVSILDLAQALSTAQYGIAASMRMLRRQALVIDHGLGRFSLTDAGRAKAAGASS